MGPVLVSAFSGGLSDQGATKLEETGYNLKGGIRIGEGKQEMENLAPGERCAEIHDGKEGMGVGMAARRREAATGCDPGVNLMRRGSSSPRANGGHRWWQGPSRVPGAGDAGCGNGASALQGQESDTHYKRLR